MISLCLPWSGWHQNRVFAVGDSTSASQRPARSHSVCYRYLLGHGARYAMMVFHPKFYQQQPQLASWARGLAKSGRQTPMYAVTAAQQECNSHAPVTALSSHALTPKTNDRAEPNCSSACRQRALDRSLQGATLHKLVSSSRCTKCHKHRQPCRA